jgi:DNA-binding response OmpR family regulator
MIQDKKRLLLVDDEEVILFGFGQVLAEPGLQIDTARTAEEAKALVRENSYHAAVLDMRLSDSTEMEGLELTAFIRSHQKDCRVIVLTAYGDDTVRLKALDAGADLFLEKPVGPAQIKTNLRALGVYG